MEGSVGHKADRFTVFGERTKENRKVGRNE